jgi:GNAT superfamily N-acetyltransferase
MIVVAPEGLIAQGVSIEREAFTRELYQELAPLLELHWREIAHFEDIALDVDVARYHAMEQAGILRAFVARMDGKPVGYACFVVAPHAHYKGSLQALQDVLYVDPACRCSAIGLRLIRHCDAELAAEGVQVVLQHAKVKHQALHVILPREGYEAVDMVYVKRLDSRQEV